MTESNQRNILSTYQAATKIHNRIQRDQETLKTIEANLKQLVQSGATTGDPILDLVLHYGLPCNTGFLEQNLRRLDERLRQYAGEFILLEVAESKRDSPTNIQTVVGVIANEAPMMKFEDAPDAFRGIRIMTKTREAIYLSDDAVKEFGRTSKSEERLIGLLLCKHTMTTVIVTLVVGYDAVEEFISPSYYSMQETPETRQARMKRVTRKLYDFSIDLGISLSENHLELSNALLNQFQEDISTR